MDEISFDQFFGTIFRYLKFLNLIPDDFTTEVGTAKFKQYDYNKNGTISFDEFDNVVFG